MKLHSDNGDFLTIRISKEECEEIGNIKKGNLICYNSFLYKIMGKLEDGHGNTLVMVEPPIEVIPIKG